MENFINELFRRASNMSESEKKTFFKRVAAVLAAAGLTATGISALISKYQGNAKNEAVVKYVETNLYKALPKRNSIDRLDKGNAVVYTKGSLQEWSEGENGKLHKFIKINDVIEGLIKEDDEIVEENIHRPRSFSGINPNDDLYVLKSSIDEYVRYNVNTELLKFRPRPSTDGDDYKMAINGELYVCEDCEGIGEHNFKKAILVDENGSMNYGYVADENGYISFNEEDKTCIGVANDYTYIRTDPSLPEYDSNNVERMITNGEIIEIVDSQDQYCYECKVAGDKNTYFIRKNTVIAFDEFDYDALYDSIENVGNIYGFADDGSLIVRKDSNGEIANVSDGDQLKVDINSSKNGYYSVYDEKAGVVGYVEANKLIDKKSGKSIEEILDPKAINERNNKLSETNSQENQSNNETSKNVDTDNTTSIVLDRKYLTLSDIKNLVEYYESKGIKVSAIEFSIGATCSSQNFGISTIKDSDDVYSKYMGDKNTESIQKTYDFMKNKTGMHVGVAHSRGDMKDLIDGIEYVIDKGIAIGLYYYSAPINEDEVSWEAAYINSVISCLNTYSEKYREYDKKLPFAIDIEKFSSNQRETTDNTRRAELTFRLIELLGNGVSVDESKYTCTDGIKASDGYNVVSKEKGIMIYGDIRDNKNDLNSLLSSPLNKVAKSYDDLREVIEDEGYNFHLWGSCRATIPFYSDEANRELAENEIKDLQDIPGLLAKHEQGDNNIIKDLLEDCSMAQVVLERNANGIGHDVSITSDSLIQEMVRGESHYDTFRRQIDSVGKENEGNRTIQANDFDDIDIG